MGDAFQYLFRFCCDPGFNDNQELALLPRFVQKARVDDVLVFANVQEINTGHMGPEEQAQWLEFMKRVQAAMAPMDVTMSVNHWHSLMHADLGKRLRPEQNFCCMVDPAGNTSKLCVCPLDGEWRHYITGVYARYSELHPAFVWVEDDFRLHNHDPLVWGGCFCEEHMRRYSEQAGKELTREEFVRGLLEPGGVHPYRKIWLDVNREAMVETARLIEKAVHAVSPLTRVGLMSSVPEIHAAEGRDWYGILRGFAGEDVPPVNRAHLPTYCEMAPGEYQMRFNAVTMLTRAMVPPETEIYPELENYPYSRFVKSKRFTRFQMLSALPANLAGVTIDLYDLNGNGIVWQEGYQDMLAEVKDTLNDLNGSGVFRRRAGGVAVLYSADSSYNLLTLEGKAMEELYPRETFWASLLPDFGIPFRYCSNPADAGGLCAVSGQYFRNLTQEQIRTLFAENLVLMDGEAAETLFDLGLGILAGIRSVEWMPQDQGYFTYEEVCDGREYTGRQKARASAVMLASDALKVVYETDAPNARNAARPLTMLCDSFRSVRAPGLTVSGNAAVFPFGHFSGWPGMPDVPRNFRTTVRQELMQQLMRNRKNAPPMVLENPDLNPYFYPRENGFDLYLTNACLDDISELRLWAGTRSVSRVTAYNSVGGGEHEVRFRREGEIFVLKEALNGLECVLLRVEA